MKPQAPKASELHKLQIKSKMRKRERTIACRDAILSHTAQGYYP